MHLSIEFKKNDRKILSILWDGTLWRELPKALFFSELKKIPQTVEWGEFLKQFKALEEKVARKEALILLSKRSYLSSDLEAKLISKALSEAASHAAIAFCREKGYLNDAQEIARLITKEQKKGLGPKAIFFKLKQKKRINDHQLLHGLGQTELSEKQALEKWLEKNSRKIKRSDHLEMRKLMAKLIRRGFSAEVVFSTLGRNS